MKLIKFLLILSGLLLISLSNFASAHLLDVEEQAYDPKPWQNDEGDSSFLNPHLLKFGVVNSQAIFAWLDAEDVDVYQFTVTLEDIAQGQTLGFPTAMAIASPIPPACQRTKNNYPAIALVAPFGTAPVQDPDDFDLPFDVPPGHGVLPVYNTPVHGNEERVIFYLPPEDTDEPLNLSWFLPTGCTVEPFDCSQADALGAPIFSLTTAYFVVWDPDGVPQDYTLNVGVDESQFQHFEEIEDFVRDNNHLHGPCTEPYPGN
jgi:hypothetical protein